MRVRVWLGLAGLCLLAGSEWIADLVAPRAMPALLGLAVRGALIAGLAGLLGRGGGRGGLRVALWGACLLVPLPLAYAAAGESVSFLTKLLVAAFVPVGVVFFRAQQAQGFGAQGAEFPLLLPALAGFGGAGLVIAYTIPGTGAGKAWLVGMFVAALATGFAVTQLHEALGGVGVWRGTALVAGGAAVVAASFAWVGWQGSAMDARSIGLGLGRLVLVDGPVIVLTVWLVRELEPVGFAARYLLVPLVAVVESYLVVRSGGNWTMLLGVALMAGASWMLVRQKGSE